MNRALAGVVATDVTFKTLTDFVRTLKVSERGVDFVVDADGVMIASSGQALPFKLEQGAPQRLRTEDMRTPLIRSAYAAELNRHK